MRTSLPLLTLAAAFFLAACGAPEAGDECNSNGFLCADATTALECSVGKWRALPCRGPSGCEVEDNRVTCDMSLNQAGDACASSTEGAGLCEPSGTSALQCRSGVLVQTSCTSCTTSGEEIICNQ